MTELSGGGKLEAALKDLSSKLESGGAIKVGFLSGATYPNGTPVAMIAAIQDFGAPAAGIPPRPFFRNMIAGKSNEWGPAVADLLKTTNYDVDKTLRTTGEAIASQLQQSIIDTNEPPLKEATVRAKGFSKPLIDTSHMINSVGYEVSARSGSSRYTAAPITFKAKA